MMGRGRAMERFSLDVRRSDPIEKRALGVLYALVSGYVPMHVAALIDERLYKRVQYAVRTGKIRSIRIGREVFVRSSDLVEMLSEFLAEISGRRTSIFAVLSSAR